MGATSDFPNSPRFSSAKHSCYMRYDKLAKTMGGCWKNGSKIFGNPYADFLNKLCKNLKINGYIYLWNTILLHTRYVYALVCVCLYVCVHACVYVLTHIWIWYNNHDIGVRGKKINECRKWRIPYFHAFELCLQFAVHTKYIWWLY